jgi:predicted ATPase
VNAKSIVVTGGPNCGKTTLVGEFSKQGCATVPEAALPLILELEKAHGREGQKGWRRRNFAEFQRMVAVEANEAEQRALADAGWPVFFDRAVPDGIGFCRYCAVAVPEELARLSRARTYDLVLVLDTLEYDESASGRMFRYVDSVGIGARIEAVYRELGCRVVRIPVAPVGERIAAVRGLLE